jgi:hypothetical protein
MSQSFVRDIYRVRSKRLMFLFLLAGVMNLTLAAFFPLWVLVIGPVIYGVPHVLASIRYTHASHSSEASSGARFFNFVTLILASVAIFRILTDLGYLPFSARATDWPELLSLIATFVGAAVIYRKRPLTILVGGTLVAFVVFLSWSLPIWTAGVLLLAHNLIAFVYWILAAKSPSDRKTAVIATAIFSFVSGLILFGMFDRIWPVLDPQLSLTWAGLDYEYLGESILPWTKSYHAWFNAVVAYAFGQSMHYFVWLKAIPEQNYEHQTPPSFRRSFELLRQDFGGKFLMGFLLVALAIPAVWLFAQYPAARMVYFAVASYHGYLEIAGLCLQPFSQK